MGRSTGPTVAVIPARYASTRLPGKPLLAETGKPLIRHVWERVRECAQIDRILVATDDDRIFRAVKDFGGEAVMTSAAHPTGTDRIAEAVRNVDCAKVLNVQGDEPDLDPSMLTTLIGLLDTAEMATLATPFEDARDAGLPGRVKVVLDRQQRALYFSRSRIPWTDGAAGALLHVGVYGYTKSFLQRFVALDRGVLEQSERLEQLRALEHGCAINVAVVRWASTGGIDTPEDYAAFVRRVRGEGVRA